VREYSEKFDRWSPVSFRLGSEQIDEIVATVPSQAIEDIRTVQARVREFAQRQRHSLLDFEAEAEHGVAAAVVAMLHMPGLCGADIDLSAGMVARYLDFGLPHRWKDAHAARPHRL
jgi:Histidinol dehydrogenase